MCAVLCGRRRWHTSPFEPADLKPFISRTRVLRKVGQGVASLLSQTGLGMSGF
jgi:hypothetical protein